MTTPHLAPPNLSIAKTCLLEPYGLDERSLGRVMDSVLTHRVDYADVFFQSIRQESWSIENSIVKSGSFSKDQGFGLRALEHDQTAFSYSQQIGENVLQQAASSVRSIARQGSGSAQLYPARIAPADLYGSTDPIGSLPAADKIALLQDIDRIGRAADPRVVELNASISASQEIVLVMRHDGRLAADVRPLVRLSVFVVVQQGSQRESGGGGLGGRYDLSAFTPDAIRALASQAVNDALINLDAVAMPSGEMTVVVGPGWPGMLLHESVGHGFEGDFNRQGSSIYSGKIGEQVAARGVTIVDNGTLPGQRGSLNIDDEGEVTHNTVLIEDGVLRSYMQDSMNARLSGHAPTGNGRRQSYAHLPMPRMTNTYMLAGDKSPEEIIASVDHGLYLANLGSGQVDIVNGQFTFHTTVAYKIERGKLTTPVKGATITGNGPDAMRRISMVGNDLALDKGVATCGKAGQSVPVSVGQPTIKIDRLTVGGTA